MQPKTKLVVVIENGCFPPSEYVYTLMLYRILISVSTDSSDKYIFP